MKRRVRILNKRQLIFRRVLIGIIFFCIIEGIIIYEKEIENKIPSQINTQINNEEKVYGLFPFSTEVEKESLMAVSVNNKPLSQDKINLNYGEGFVITSETAGTATITYRLFGLIDWKKTQVKFQERPKVVPLGATVGIDIKTEGILVLGTGKVQDNKGHYVEPAVNIVRSGDYIKKIDGKSVSDINEFISAMSTADDEIVLTVRRSGEDIQIKVSTVLDSSGQRKAGIWVRDSTQGIGTITFVAKDGSYGALGHSITDVDTGLSMVIHSGSLYPVQVMDIHKGKDGLPGEMCGTLYRSEDKKLGSIDVNSDVGIYGRIDSSYLDFKPAEYYDIGFKQEVETGKAQILCQLDNEGKCEIKQGELYDIEILKLDFNTSSKNKGMVIKITDRRLLDRTNGIVQGMSGSPIIQNGRVIGAVTHVFVNDCTKGYGIFIENMLAR